MSVEKIGEGKEVCGATKLRERDEETDLFLNPKPLFLISHVYSF